MAQHAYLLLTKTKTMPKFPSPRGGFGGLSTPKQSTEPPKLKHDTLYISGVFINFSISSPFAQTQSPPIEDFLATVLYVECRIENR